MLLVLRFLSVSSVPYYFSLNNLGALVPFGKRLEDELRDQYEVITENYFPHPVFMKRLK